MLIQCHSNLSVDSGKQADCSLGTTTSPGPESCSGDTRKETPRPATGRGEFFALSRDDAYWTLLCLIRMAASEFRSVMLVTAEPTVPSACNGSHVSPAGSGNATALAFEYTCVPQPD